MLFHRSRRALIAALAAFAAVPAAAQAAPYEQVTRLDGTDSFLSGESENSPIAVSDGGRYAAFSTMTPSTTSYNSTPAVDYVRDIQANRTWTPTGFKRIFGFDRAERFVLGGRTDGTTFTLVLASLTGAAPEKVLWSGPGGYGSQQAQLSADGSVVVLADPPSNRAISINVATGEATTLTPLREGTSYGNDWSLDQGAISADGRTIVLSRYTGLSTGDALRIYRDRVAVREVPGLGRVSPDGSAVAYVPGGIDQANLSYSRTLVVHNVRSGNEKRFAVPVATDSLGGYTVKPVWMSTSGAKVAVSTPAYADSGRLPLPTPKQVDYATGTWSSFGGRFGDSIGASVVAPGGRFALLPIRRWRGLALVDLTDAELPGGGDAFSPDLYLDRTGSQNTCKGTPPYYLDTKYEVRRRAKLIAPATWIPAPRRAVVTLSAAGIQVASGTITLGQTLAGNLNSVPVNTSSTRAAVTDALGRQRTLSWSVHAPCGSTDK